MSRSTRSRLALALAAAVLAIVPLSACSSTPTTSAATALTLAQVKSPVQLLRNEVAGRIPADIIDSTVQPTDESSPCKPSAEDPDEFYRTWTSGVLVLVTFDAAPTTPDIDKVRDDLIQSLVDQGWEKGDSASEKVTHLQKATTFATIDIYDQAPDKIQKLGGGVQVNVNGACVKTAGPDSTEVRTLEKVG